MLSAYYLERLVGVVALFFVPALIGLASVAESFVTAVLGKAWLESIQPLQVMSVAMVFRLCTSLYKSVISSNGRTDLHLLLSAFQFVFHVIGALFAMNYGLFGLAISWALVEFLVMLLTLAVSKKISCTSFAGLVKALLPAVFCSLCMASVVICVPLIIGEYRPFVQLLVQGFIGAMLYFFLLRMLFRDNLNLAIKVLTGKGA
jgi:O-antigen/teichoic acid export membrane protein